MTIQRDRSSRVADDYDDDQQYENSDEDSIRWDFDAFQFGSMEPNSTRTSFNLWSDASSLEKSSMAFDDSIFHDISSMEDLERRFHEIFQIQQPLKSAVDLHRRRSRTTGRTNDDAALAYHSILLNRRRVSWTRMESTQRWISSEGGLPRENQVIVSNSRIRDPRRTAVDPSLRDSVKLSRARMNDIVSNSHSRAAVDPFLRDSFTLARARMNVIESDSPSADIQNVLPPTMNQVIVNSSHIRDPLAAVDPFLWDSVTLPEQE